MKSSVLLIQRKTAFAACYRIKSPSTMTLPQAGKENRQLCLKLFPVLVYTFLGSLCKCSYITIRTSLLLVQTPTILRSVHQTNMSNKPHLTILISKSFRNENSTRE